MQTRAARSVPAVDGLRAIAALAVIVVHVFLRSATAYQYGPFNPFLAASELGVDMFFVISGFLLFLPYARGEDVDRRAYFKRRAARIMPAYVASLALVGATYGLVDHAVENLHVASPSGLLAILSHLTLTQALVLPWFSGWIGLGVNVVVWTLTLEAMFYVTLPFVARAFARNPWRWLLGAVVVSVAWRYALYAAAGTEYTSRASGAFFAYGDAYPAYFGHFAAGMLAALVLARGRVPSVGSARVFLAIGALGMVVAARFHGHALEQFGIAIRTQHTSYRFDRLAFGLAFALALYAIVALPSALGRVLGSGVLKWIGDRSYGVYLTHVIVILFLTRQTSVFESNNRLMLLVNLALVASVSIALGALSFAFIERPAMQRVRAAASQREPAP